MPKPKPLPVCDSDRANLSESGITNATIWANGLRTERASLLFPYRDLDGNVNCFARRRPHKPRVIAGKTAKYEQPAGTPLRAYFPAASLPLLRDGKSSVYITEGEKKALALSQLGLAAIGVGGIWCGCKKGQQELIADLAAIPWTGRVVYVVFDHDTKATTRKEAAAAKACLANALAKVGAKEILDIDLPPGPDGAKQGVDDFLVAHGPEVFGTLVARSIPVINVINWGSPEVDGGGNFVIKIAVAPPELGEKAYLGLAGRFVRAVAPYTEATDAGVLAHLLTAAGSLAGPGPHVWAGSKQSARVNAVLVGPTNAGRKGTSFAPVDLLMRMVDAQYWNSQRVNGLSSGEGLIAYVADKEEWNADTKEMESVAVEKRLYVVEEEYSRVLANISREGNVLSQVLRSCFDSGDLATLTVTPRRASGAHVSVVGHITAEELKDRFKNIEMANGFGNRFLWFVVKSDKVMPHTRPIPGRIFSPFLGKLKALLRSGQACKDQPVQMNADAASLWEKVYPQLRQDRPGLGGAMVSRGPSMVLRLALTYALLESELKGLTIRVEHLEAALAVWEYCEQSALSLFHSRTGDPLGDKLLELLAGGPMTKDDFNKHLSVKQKAAVGPALEKLEASKLIRKTRVKREGAGRPSDRYELV